MIHHKKLIRWISKFPYLLGFSVLFFEIGAIFLIFQFKLISQVINRVIFQYESLENLTPILILIACFVFFRGLLNFLGEIISKRIAKNVKNVIRNEFISIVLTKRGDKWTHSGEFLTIFYARVEALEDYFSLFLPQVALSILIPISILFFVFPLDNLSAVVFLVTAPLIPFFMVLIGKFSEKKNQKQWKALSSLSTFFLDSIRGLKTLLLFNQEEKHLERIKRANDNYFQVTTSVLKISFLSALVLELLSMLSIAVVAVEIGLRLLYFKISFEQAFFILLIAPDFYLPLRNLGARFHAAINGVEGYKELEKFLESDENDENHWKEINFPKETNRIQLKNLTIQFSNQEKPVISNLSFCFDQGRHYALIGANATGKSSLFRALLRFIPPVKGKIFIDDMDFTNISPEKYYPLFSWLPQNPAIFQGSIFENIQIADPGITREKIEMILEKVDLLDFVNSLPNGMNTITHEFGITISSGQKQKIALARLMIRDAPIVICDEPTTHLDPSTEEITSRVLKEFTQNKIYISIAHKLKTIKDADRILFFQKNFPIVTGSFETLKEENQNFRKYINFYFGGSSG